MLTNAPVEKKHAEWNDKERVDIGMEITADIYPASIVSKEVPFSPLGTLLLVALDRVLASIIIVLPLISVRYNCSFAYY